MIIVKSKFLSILCKILPWFDSIEFARLLSRTLIVVFTFPALCQSLLNRNHFPCIRTYLFDVSCGSKAYLSCVGRQFCIPGMCTSSRLVIVRWRIAALGSGEVPTADSWWHQQSDRRRVIGLSSISSDCYFLGCFVINVMV